MKSITVVGSGIVGLTTALILQENGFSVKITAKEKYDKTLSSKVGAIWFPFEIQPKEKANHWATLAYNRYENDLVEGNGVSFIPFITSYNAESNTDWTLQLPQNKVRKAAQHELPNGIEMAYIATVPLAEPQLYLPYLFEKFIKNGGAFQQREISSIEDLAMLDEFVINCTGLGAKKLCNDHDLQPMRGQILRCKKMNAPSCADSIKKGALSYLIHRSTDCVIGGTDYENDWNENTDQTDTQLILERFSALGISTEIPEIIEEIVGLRPKRSAVRFEWDAVYPMLFHNYGHGGAGFTVAWGCAIELGGILKNR